MFGKTNYNTDNLSRIVISKINAFRETFQNVLKILRGYYEESIKILQLNLVILTLIWMIILQIIYIISSYNEKKIKTKMNTWLYGFRR